MADSTNQAQSILPASSTSGQAATTNQVQLEAYLSCFIRESGDSDLLDIPMTPESREGELSQTEGHIIL